MYATIVKLNALADAVWAAAKNDHFFPLGGLCLAFRRFVKPFVRGVHIRCVAFKFCRARVDAFVDGVNVKGVTGGGYLGRPLPGQFR